MKIAFRPLQETDVSLILSSWLKSAYNLCPAFGDMPRSLYYGLHEPAVKMLLLTSDVMCAVDIEDPGHVLGYVVYKHYNQFSVLHWIYTKQQFRHFKIGKHLLKTINLLPMTFTSHETIDSRKFLSKNNVKVFYVPHLSHGEWHEEQFHNFLKVRGEQ